MTPSPPPSSLWAFTWIVIEWCLCTLENVDFIGFIIIVVRGGGGEGGELVDRSSIVRSFVRSFVRSSIVRQSLYIACFKKPHTTENNRLLHFWWFFTIKTLGIFKVGRGVRQVLSNAIKTLIKHKKTQKADYPSTIRWKRNNSPLLKTKFIVLTRDKTGENLVKHRLKYVDLYVRCQSR